MKGVQKLFQRLPHILITKTGLQKESKDLEFQEIFKDFSHFQATISKLLQNFIEFSSKLSISTAHLVAFVNKFCNNDKQSNSLSLIKESLNLLIEMLPILKFQKVELLLQNTKKLITKRNNKLLDFDRHNDSFLKLQAKKDKNLNDEKKLGQIQNLLEISTREYNSINNLLKSEIPTILQLKETFVIPGIKKFYFIQLESYKILFLHLNDFVAFYDLKSAKQVFIEKQEIQNILLTDFQIVKRNMNGFNSNSNDSSDIKTPPKYENIINQELLSSKRKIVSSSSSDLNIDLNKSKSNLSTNTQNYSQIPSSIQQNSSKIKTAHSLNQNINNIKNTNLLKHKDL